MPRVILHVDMNAFFAAVEQMCNPALRGRPVIVCGDPERRSVVSTASYEARRYGVESGMPASTARRLCPDGVFIEGSPRKYIYYSLEILKLYSCYTSYVEPFSIDEAFLDLSATEYCTFDIARSVAAEMKSLISNKYPCLSASIGIGPNKYVAKMASSLEKPDGLVVIEDLSKYRRIFWPRPVGSLWGVGEKTKKLLNGVGIFSVEQLATASEELLRGLMGENGASLRKLAWGNDETEVVPYHRGLEVKSMGHEHTLRRDSGDIFELERVLLRLCDQLGRRLRKEGCRARTVCVKLRFSDFKTITRQRTIDKLIDDDLEIYRVARTLFRENIGGRKVRLIGVKASGLDFKGAQEGLIFSQMRKHFDLVAAVDSLRDKYGENILVRAGCLGGTGNAMNLFPDIRAPGGGGTR